ncbi:MAG: acyl carrier protein [Bacteroidia bacterium]|nr:acyl carrier protein [Bacteroidia bacterium]
MNTPEIIEKLTPIFKDVLDIEEVTLTEVTSAADIEEWDSLSHIQLIVAIEKTFKLKFTSIEIAGFKNIGDLCKTIQTKMA